MYDVKIVLKTLKGGRKIHRKSTGDYKMMYFKFFSEGKKFYIIKEAVLYDAQNCMGVEPKARDFEDVQNMDRREIA